MKIINSALFGQEPSGDYQLLTPNEPFDLKPAIEDQMVNHPPHYNSHPSGVECITVTEHFNFNIGNAIKYLWRSDHKNGLQDLKKARWYVDREIERKKNESQ